MPDKKYVFSMLIQTHLMLCHCEKPKATKQSQKMDCFASLAMTIIAFVLTNIKCFFLTAILLLSFLAPILIAGDSEIMVLFSPQDECGKEILARISSAEKSIELAMYMLTSRALSNALVSAAKRGVTVRVFLDGENAEEYYSKAGFLTKNGVIVKMEKGEGLMHNKFCAIDNKIVITGSYNWTVTADLKNDENVIIIESDKIAKIFRVQFEKYWQGAYPDVSFYADKNTLTKIHNLK